MWYVTYGENDILHAASKKGMSATKVPSKSEMLRMALSHFKKTHPNEKRITNPAITILSVNTKNRSFKYTIVLSPTYRTTGTVRY